ncbi:MAG: phenylacetate--CoA ligase family protein [Anaerolineae bacterium]|nr:phenylacetate--CoA ligase family protein [Anaerolineae bacterium]
MDIRMMLSVFRELDQMRKRESWTRQQLETHQTESLQRLRDYAYVHSPFYQRFHKGLTNRPLQELPVLTKTMLMENFDELVTDRTVRLEDLRAHMANDREGKRFLNRYWVTATSGSTGHPGIFLFNRDEWSVVVASLGRAHEWSGVPMTPTHRMKMASVASLNTGSPWHMGAQVAKTFNSPLMRAWMPTLSFDAAQPLAEIVEQLNDWQPHLLTGYASMMRILADEQLDGRLHIHPHMIIPGSEVLTDETRRLIEEVWGHPPFNAYGATEGGGGLAAETSDHNGLYLFEDNVIFEVVDEQYRPVPPGEFGDKVLITVLSSRTQPLIRYELSDSVRLASDTSRGSLPFARIDGIQGRTEDILRLPGVSGDEVAVHPITFHHVLDSLPASGWQVIQEPDGLRVLLSGAQTGVNDAELVDTLTHNLTAQNVVAPPISVQHVDVIPKNATGKAPLIKAHHSPVSPKHLQRLTKVKV